MRASYDLAFQISPIILTGGIATPTNGGALPVIALLGQLAGFAQGVLSNNDVYARFVPMPGATAINNSIGMYPFADQHVAGNAYINEPLNISLQMIAPVKDTAGYLTKLSLFTALRNSFFKHIEAGGTFTVLTPSMIYQNCLMMSMTDVSGSNTHQQQILWRIDFTQPLITKAQAKAAVNGLMDVFNNGKKLTGQPTWGAGAAAVGKAVNQFGQGAQNVLNAVDGILAQ